MTVTAAGLTALGELGRAHARLDPERVKDWLAANPAAAQVMVEQYHRQRVELARKDVDEFIELVGRDEETGAPLLQAPVHEAFQDLANRHPRLVLHAHIESGKTSQLSILRTLWLLGRNPNARVAVVSNTATQAEKLVSAIKSYIEKSEALHEVFPHLTPGKKWTGKAITVAGRSTHSKDYSVQGLGVHGAILGARIDHLVLDDILDYENTRTPEQRKALSQWVRATLLGRITRRGTVLAVGTPWHPEDLYHELAKDAARWRSARFPVLDEATGESRWPERFPKDVIAERARDLGPLEAARQLYCRAKDDADQRFRKAWIAACLERGLGRRLAHTLQRVPEGYAVITGVDLGVKQKVKSDPTVLFTLAVAPNGDRHVLCVEAGRWTGPQIIARIVDHHRRYHSWVYVEGNAAQDFITQFTKHLTAVPVKSLTTGGNKHDPEFGVESLAVEMFNAKWVIPAVDGGADPEYLHLQAAHPEIAAWIAEMDDYQPGAHTGDRLMAAWIAREGARLWQTRPRAQQGRLRANKEV